METTFWSLLGLVSFVTWVACVPMLVYHLTMKTGQARKILKYAGIAFLVFLLAVAVAPEADSVTDDPLSVESSSPETTAPGTVRALPAVEQESDVEGEQESEVEEEPAPESTDAPATGSEPGTGEQRESTEAVTVYITDTGSKYHVESCRHLSKSKIPISLDDAKQRGYEPCGVCKPGW